MKRRRYKANVFIEPLFPSIEHINKSTNRLYGPASKRKRSEGNGIDNGATYDDFEIPVCFVNTKVNRFSSDLPIKGIADGNGCSDVPSAANRSHECNEHSSIRQSPIHRSSNSTHINSNEKALERNFKNGRAEKGLGSETLAECNTKDQVLYTCSICNFSTHSKQQHLEHSYDYHIWRCKCGYREKKGDLAAEHLVNCREITLYTNFTSPAKRKSVKVAVIGDKEKSNKMVPIAKTQKFNKVEKAAKIERSIDKNKVLKLTKVQETTCGKCVGCKLKRNCGKCKFCQGSTKNGKLKTPHRSCIKRKCIKIQKPVSGSSKSANELEGERNIQILMERDADEILGIMERLDIVEEVKESQSSTAAVSNECTSSTQCATFPSQAAATNRECANHELCACVKLEDSELNKTCVKSSKNCQHNCSASCAIIIDSERKIDCLNSSAGVTSAASIATNCCLPCVSGVSLVFSQTDLHGLQTLATSKQSTPSFKQWFDKMS